MLITLFCRAAICQSVAEVYLTGVGPLGAVSHRFNFFNYHLQISHESVIPDLFTAYARMWRTTDL